MEDVDLARRRLFRLLLAAPVAFVVGSQLWAGAAQAAGRRPTRTTDAKGAGGGFAPTPDCGDDDEPTPAETAGPFFKPRSPRRASLLEPGISGTTIVLSGRVFSRGCRPLAGALLDFWHADDGGEYDNVGFRLRGHQFTDQRGAYRLETIVPGLYPGRTRHIHVRVQARGGRVLTTQLYFPGEARNQEDGLYRPDLLMTAHDGGAARRARFHFLLDVA